jgi:uncharacterized protein (TIGR02284 family)
MAWRSERDIVNRLIETCRDGARGFRLAGDHVRDPELKRLFSEAAAQRETFAAELVPHARVLGGETSAPGSTAGALHRGWMTLKDAMTQYDDDAIIAEAVRGEAVAANEYAEAILGILPPAARELIESQYQQILEAQRQIDELSVVRGAG